MAQFILYACPIGPLAEQLETYFEKSQQLCGPNAAHAYMPHCTLTGFFNDDECAIAPYIRTLENVLAANRALIPEPPILIKQLTFRSDWHGLELSADGLKQLVAIFADQAASPTRLEPLRLKDWLHLSLAYEFNAPCEPRLRQLANALIDINISVNWELRFYQRNPDNSWRCHGHWPLDSPSQTAAETADNH